MFTWPAGGLIVYWHSAFYQNFIRQLADCKPAGVLYVGRKKLTSTPKKSCRDIILTLLVEGDFL